MGLGLFIIGCAEPVSNVLGPQADLGATIGSLTELFTIQSIPVEGYGLVGGLRATGSGECPPHIRSYLKQYILTQLDQGRVDVEKLINDRNTAVVRVYATMPTASARNQRFDVKVEALPATQTSSLRGGWLYKAELKRTDNLGISTRTLATVEGPIFIDTVNDSTTDTRTGYILAGGRRRDQYNITLALNQSDYLVARQISNVLNARFLHGTAKAVSPEIIEINVPEDYAPREQRFVSIVRAMYVNRTPQVVDQRVKKFVRELAVSPQKQDSEIALEAIGTACVNSLAALLGSSEQEVRLRAARCMLNVGSDNGLDTLRRIAMDKGSPYRFEALEAITNAASRPDAAAVGRKLLREDDFDVRFAAYEQLRKIDDISITRERIANSFYLEQIAGIGRPEIFAARSGQPRIVLFGAPMYCRDNTFIQSPDGEITIDAPSGRQYVSLIRKVPGKPNVVKVKSSFKLDDLIRVLCQEPEENKAGFRPGLNVSYAEAIALLKQLCEKGAVPAKFRPGPLPQIE
ncbi:MAG: flagellar basal body P-ring protein FlgI [Planctomycetota bacterium]|jgi:hypothetical protein